MRLVTQNDGLRAYMLLGKRDMGKHVDADKVKTILQRSGITFGVSLDNWDQLFMRFSRGQLHCNSILVAEGREPVAGEPGRLEFLVTLERKFPVKNHERDFLDAILLRVQKGQPIFRVHPPGKGKPGMTVTGEPIPAPEGQDAELPKLKNVVAHAQDTNLYVATINGVLTFSAEKGLTVWPLEEVPRAISSAQGPVKVEHSLLVHGDVKTGSRVHARGNVFVMGVVEDAEIVAGGDVYVLKGFIGRGKGVIRAGNNVYVQHVDNQTIQAGNNIYIDEEAMKCTLIADRCVLFTGKKASLMGGTVSVGQKLRVYRAGNVKNIRTVINVAQDRELMQKLRKKQKELAGIEAELKKVKDSIFRIVRTTASSQPLPKKYDRLLKDLLQAKERHNQAIDRLRKEILVLSDQLERQRANIRVEIAGPMYPGVLIRHAGRTYQVFRPTYNVVVTYDDF